MKMSVRRSDIRVSLCSGRSCWRVGLRGDIAGGVNGGLLGFRCEKYGLVFPPALLHSYIMVL